jgi:hypothetical protein
MSWLLYPTKPRPEYYAALKAQGRTDLEKDSSLNWSNIYMGLLTKFFEEQAGITLPAYRTGEGGMGVEWSDELCQSLADWLEQNGPPTEEQLPRQWRGKNWRGEEMNMSQSLMEEIPIYRYSGGITGNDSGLA